MRKNFLIFIFLSCRLVVFAQNGQQDLPMRIGNYLASIDSSHFYLDSTKHYLLQFSCNRKRKINNLNVYFKEGDIIVMKNTSGFNNLSFDSLYVISETKKITKNMSLVLPYIIKNVDFIKYSKAKKLFTVFDFEKMFMLLQYIQLNKRKFELLNPVIVLNLEPMY